MSTNIVFEYINTFSSIKEKAFQVQKSWAFEDCSFVQLDGEASRVSCASCYTER